MEYLTHKVDTSSTHQSFHASVLTQYDPRKLADQTAEREQAVYYPQLALILTQTFAYHRLQPYKYQHED